MATSKRNQLPKLDLSKYEGNDRLPGNVVSIIKNALVIYEGDSKKVAKNYNLTLETVNMVLEENYLQIHQIISSQMKSKELDNGINNAILLMVDHVNALQEEKSNSLMTKSTITDVTRITDRFLNLKSQFNNTYDTLVNKMNDQSLKNRQVEVLENGKFEDSSEYNQNVETVFSKLKSTISRKIKATNINTKEVKHYNSIASAANDLGCNGDTIRKRLSDKCLHKNEWAFEEE